MKRIQKLTDARLLELLEIMKGRRAVLLGDMCLDVYWFADMTLSVLSRETPHFPLPVTEERMSAGAGGNVAVNLSKLCGEIIPVGVIGNDWRGNSLCDVFKREGISTDYIIRSDEVITNAYCKPMRVGYMGVPVEDPRIDFEMRAPYPRSLEDELIRNLSLASCEADVLCVSDQFLYGCVSERVRNKVEELSRGGLLTVVDSRSRIALYRNVILKPNEIECARAVRELCGDAELDVTSEENIEALARALSEKTSSDVCLTLGERGSLIIKDGKACRIKAVKNEPPVDIVGAGDAFLSAFSLALSSGADIEEAGVIGSLASAVTVKKLNTTGTASAEELLALMEREGEV